MSYEYKEYPKSLYLKGEERVVNDEAEDAAAAADGFTDWNTDHVKTHGAPVSASGEAGATEGEVTLTRDQMKEKAKALGLEFKHNISNAALAELVAGETGG